MSIYRCAYCGSPNLMVDTQSGGVKYDYVKGAVGTVILGTGGAVAGIKNTTQTVYKCPDCGMTLTYSMPESIKTVIDIGVQSADARKNLSIDWEFLVKKYKNIETGRGDEEARKQREIIEGRKIKRQELVNMIAQKVIERIPEMKSEIELYTDHIYYNDSKEIQQKWEEKYLPILEQKEKARAEAKKQADDERTAGRARLEKMVKSEKDAVAKKAVPLLQEQEQLRKKLSTLGFFNFSEKRAINERLEQIPHLLAEIEQEKKRNNALWNRMYDDAIHKDNEEYQTKLHKAFLDIEKKYPVEESPDHRHKKGSLLYYVTKKAKEECSVSGWESLEEVILYYALSVMEDLTGGLPVIFDSIFETDITAQCLNPDDAVEIIKIVFPELCRAFDIMDGSKKYRCGARWTGWQGEKMVEYMELLRIEKIGNYSYCSTNV